jgi:hypothetical protein
MCLLVAVRGFHFGAAEIVFFNFRRNSKDDAPFDCDSLAELGGL